MPHCFERKHGCRYHNYNIHV